jgi:hypothetical protein
MNEQMVERLASEIARRSGYDPNSHNSDQWRNIANHYRETARQYLRVAFGYDPVNDLDEITWNGTTHEIKGVDGEWHEVPESVVERYAMVCAMASANYENLPSQEQLGSLCEILYGPVYATVNAEAKQAMRNGLFTTLQKVMQDG